MLGLREVGTYAVSTFISVFGSVISPQIRDFAPEIDTLQAVLQTVVAATACAARWLTQQSEARRRQIIVEVFEFLLCFFFSLFFERN